MNEGARVTHPAEIIPAEIDQHEVLGALLFIGEQLLGVPVGCRDDCLAATKRIGQRTRNGLLHIQIGGDVQIGGPNELS